MKRPTRLTDAGIDDIVGRVAEGARVRRYMPGWGRLLVDRPQPFIVVYRRPADRADTGADRLAVGPASYLLADEAARPQDTRRLLHSVVRTLGERFGACLVIEVWSAEPADESPAHRPSYRVCTRRGDELDDVASEVAASLAESRILHMKPTVTTEECAKVAPPGMRQLFTARELRSAGASLIGLEVTAAFRESVDGPVFPNVLRQMRRRVTTALSRGAYEFTHDRTAARPAHHLALGRRAFTRTVWDIDAELADIGQSYDLLLQVTPVNSERAWAAFQRSHHQRCPHFVYRPLPVDIGVLKRRLWTIRPERVEDPTLMYLFRGVQRRLDRQLTLLADIGTRDFLHTSLQLHGTVDPELFRTAEYLLDRLPQRARTNRATRLDAAAFASRAAAQIEGYRATDPDFGRAPEVRDDIYTGLYVSNGRLYVGSRIRVPEPRADALLQHEVGTHVVTHHNGTHQPLKLLAVGLPGYDELQEGLAVLAEHLVGGLDADRMRVLAARVTAVAGVADGAGFVDTYRMLIDRGFRNRTAFTIAVRVHRGGGLTKDAMYLRGLQRLLTRLSDGCSFERLFVGKYGLGHIPVIDELLLRGVLSRPAVLPSYLQRPEAVERLEAVQRGVELVDLVSESTRT